jgi:hypothetical protein
MDLEGTRARWIAALATGIAACRPEAKPDATPVATQATTTTSTASATVEASATPTATASAVASVTPSASAAPTATATATATVIAKPARLKCEAPAKLSHDCYAKNTSPPTGGGRGGPIAPYTGFDANGCFPAHELVGTCLGTRDAVGPVLEHGQCCYDVCGGLPVPCGRPMLVGGTARVARTTARGDWMARVGADLDDADAARAWREDAALEHASIASFARLALQLVALGAPPELVAAANAAALDEIEHAKICFALAARFGHPPVGPAPISLEGVSLATSLEDVALEAATQSCVGETVAAFVLSRASELCAPDISALLAKMSEDELAHATLGWNLISWACAQGGDCLRRRVKEALVVGDYAAPIVRDLSAWHRAGRLGREDLDDVTKKARALVAEVVAAWA